MEFRDLEENGCKIELEDCNCYLYEQPEKDTVFTIIHLHYNYNIDSFFSHTNRLIFHRKILNKIRMFILLLYSSPSILRAVSTII